ncbi:hypothetical protein [Nocardiopsis composta]|uniref:Uncharacterized protein n=1 Tax=Nocardiopsis composta TaxID=157465 RepID=A0A7W8VFL2_9ACTN|nr:hypothetical protein [Nocardiopsis composta]MBB5434532.1 hypothetical protein [Nocardiopsis composta]
MPSYAAPRRAALSLLGLLALAPAAACTENTEVHPGPARPAASATDGFPLRADDALYAVNDVNVVLPEGWRAIGSDGCLAPPGNGGEAQESCPPTALRIRTGAAEDGLIDADGGSLDDEDGWKRPWTVCPGSVGQVGSVAPKLVEAGARERFELVSGEWMEAAAWTLACADGRPFETRIWYVPGADIELDVPIVDPSVGGDEYERIARSADLSRYLG